ncbi:hypothetical protein GGS20DRAFT_115217 [Poronia punctata]|nr:hypothetical protein GGS20DRAFT_115217 [Poronia punctata]
MGVSYDPITELGLTCPSGGKVSICQDSSLKFLGCCTTTTTSSSSSSSSSSSFDPCLDDGEGGCPSTDLEPLHFNPSKYQEIPPQRCAVFAASWYTCTNGNTFIGCCTSNPCDNGGECPGEDLVGAVLSEDRESRAVFLTTMTATSASASVVMSSGVVESATATATATPTPEDDNDNNGNNDGNNDDDDDDDDDDKLPIGGIVGGIIAVLVVLGLIAFILLRHRRRRRRRGGGGPRHSAVMNSPPPPPPPYNNDNISRKSPYSPIGVPQQLQQQQNHQSYNKRLSQSLGSMFTAGFKRSSLVAAKGQQQQQQQQQARPPQSTSTSWVEMGLGQQQQQPVAELDGRPAYVVYHEVEGSIPGQREYLH